jgi:hypothetical protein
MEFSARASVELLYDLHRRKRALRQDQDVNPQIPDESGDLVKGRAIPSIPGQNVHVNALRRRQPDQLLYRSSWAVEDPASWLRYIEISG